MSKPFITITSQAAVQIKKILRDEPESSMVRVRVNGGGCAGFQYQFTTTLSIEEDDVLFEEEGVIVLVDETSLSLISGAKLDFVDDVMSRSFRVINPNARSSCGCGTSFSI